jgi:hypothetical protein
MNASLFVALGCKCQFACWAGRRTTACKPCSGIWRRFAPSAEPPAARRRAWRSGGRVGYVRSWTMLGSSMMLGSSAVRLHASVAPRLDALPRRLAAGVGGANGGGPRARAGYRNHHPSPTQHRLGWRRGWQQHRHALRRARRTPVGGRGCGGGQWQRCPR